MPVDTEKTSAADTSQDPARNYDLVVICTAGRHTVLRIGIKIRVYTVSIWANFHAVLSKQGGWLDWNLAPLSHGKKV